MISNLAASLFHTSIADRFYQTHRTLIDTVFQKPVNTDLSVFFFSHLYWWALIVSVLIPLCAITLKPFRFAQKLKIIGWGYKEFWKFTLILALVFTPLGWAFGLIMENHDPVMPAFYFLPWTCSNIYFLNQLLEDWIFYAATAWINAVILVYTFWLSERFAEKAKDGFRSFRVIILFALLAIFSLVALKMDFMGRIHVLLFGLPSFAGLLYLSKKDAHFNSKIFLLVFLPMMFAYGIIYDFSVVFAPPHLFHAPWAQAYVYIIPGVWEHSTAFAVWPKGWLFKEFPFSVDFGMAFFGAYLWYTVGLFARKWVNAS